MRPYDKEMTMTMKVGNPQERISPEDLYWARLAVALDQMRINCRTYEFYITSDMYASAKRWAYCE